MVRKVSFLQDPSVISAPLDKRIAFLQSKNLTQEEIDVALARAGDPPQSQNPPSPPPPQSYGYPSQQMTRQPNGYGYGYGPYPSGPWSQSLEPPRRDWRDYFIVATLTSTLGYTLYALSRRYIAPLISPPTPPQLEADKASIDASFARAFALIDQLAADTASLKELETQRQEKLDKALDEVNSVVEELRRDSERRGKEGDMLRDQVVGLRESIPRALDGWKREGDGRIEDLSGEVRSLKKLVATRMAAPSSASTTLNPLNPSVSPSRGSTGAPPPSYVSNAENERPKSQERGSNGGAMPVDVGGLGGKVAAGKASYEGAEMGATEPTRKASSNSLGFGARGGRAAIPAWQLPAQEQGGKGEGEG
ncbi:MAG: hypothetical protein L6R37_000544 [Teloschistes peruensis]|nr:MAG: hypothetical protein L6R37_000544 [Teloschistes peruensis]